MIVSTVRKGYKFTLDNTEYEVIGSQSFRGRYIYIVINQATMQKQSISRDNMLQWQMDDLLVFKTYK